MRIQFRHTDKASEAWQPGEVLTVKIAEVEGDLYTAETIETWPPDLREQHRAELERLAAEHRRALGAEEAEGAPIQ